MTAEKAPTPLRPVLGDPPPRRARTKDELFARRMFELAGLLMVAPGERDKFADLMREIAKDFTAGTVGEAQFFDRMREATDLLPMSKKTALEFSTKIYGILTKENADDGAAQSP